MNSRAALLFIGVFAAGCASYTQTKIDLAARAQSAVIAVRADVEAQRSRTLASGEALRARLDAAFDEDVTSRGDSLDAEWVIAHRKAYALAVDAFEADRRTADANEQLILRTLDAIAAALDQLQQMHASELRLSVPELKLPELKFADAKEAKSWKE